MSTTELSSDQHGSYVSEETPLTGPGGMADQVRSKDWGSTPLGPRELWSDTLISLVNLVLSSPFPAALFFGPRLTAIYNDAYCAFLDARHPEALGKPAHKLWAEIWSAVGGQYEAVVTQGVVISKQRELIPLLEEGVFKDYYWTYSLSPIYEQGKIAGILNVAQNITAEVNAARERDTVTARLTQILADTNDAIMTMDRDWHVTYMNPRALAISHPVNPVGKNLWECYPHLLYPGSPWVETYHRAMDQGLPGSLEEFYPDPINVWVAVQVQPSKGGITLFFEDVTERKRASEALAESQKAAVRSEAQLKGITDALPTLISYIDRDYRYVRVNRAYEEWFGRPAADLIGRSVSEVVGEAVAKAMCSPMEEAFRGVPQHLEFPLTRRGEERLLRVTHIPDADEHGQVRGIIVQSEDITDRKRAEESMMQTEKLAAAGRLAASIAHEINNPLESVTNLLYLARTSADTHEKDEYIDIADRELRRVSAIASQTLRFYKQTTRPTEVRGQDLFDSVVSIYQGKILNSRVHVERRDRQALPVECLEGEIRQVLINLVGNAIDALHGTGGTLFLRSQEGRNWQNGEPGIVLTVADNGGGMSPGVQSRIFEAFYSTKGVGGTGLGLWVSKEIVDRHLGRLTVRSTEAVPRSGTVFRLFLPFPSTPR